MDILRGTLLCLCLVSAGLGVGSPNDGWKTFKSTKYRFTVCYPASWYLFHPMEGALDILNFPPDQRVKGVVLKESGARINVGRAPSQVQSVEQWIKEDTKFHTRTSERQIKEFAKSPPGCMELVEVTSLSEVGPGAYFRVTSYYCSTRYGLYGVSLLNWEGDLNQEQLQEIALKVAVSLRSW